MSNSNTCCSPFTRIAALALLALTVVSCGGPNLIDRITTPRWGFCGTLVIIADLVALVDLLGDDHRSTTNKVLWALAIVLMPILGVILYFVFAKD